MTPRRPRPAPGPLPLGLALVLLLFGATLGLGGCAALDALDVVTREPPRLYNLTPKSSFDDGIPRVDATLAVEVPTATAGLNRTRIALNPTPTTLDYYADAQWVDVAPVMVQNLLIESFDNADAIDVLGRETFGLRADYALLTHLREFQAEYTKGPGRPPEVDVRIQARLVELPRRDQIATTSVGAVVPARGTSVAAVITAFDQAFGEAVKDLVQWAVKEIARAQGAAET